MYFYKTWVNIYESIFREILTFLIGPTKLKSVILSYSCQCKNQRMNCQKFVFTVCYEKKYWHDALLPAADFHIKWFFPLILFSSQTGWLTCCYFILRYNLNRVILEAKCRSTCNVLTCGILLKKSLVLCFKKGFFKKQNLM